MWEDVLHNQCVQDMDVDQVMAEEVDQVMAEAEDQVMVVDVAKTGPARDQYKRRSSTRSSYGRQGRDTKKKW